MRFNLNIFIALVYGIGAIAFLIQSFFVENLTILGVDSIYAIFILILFMLHYTQEYDLEELKKQMEERWKKRNKKLN